MKSRFMLGVAVCLAGLFMLSGCAKEPAEAIGAAMSALEAAKAAEASVYAPRDLAAAEDARVQLEAELAAQKKKFALFRSYGKSTEMAVNAKALADRTSEAAKAGKERARNEAAQSIAQVKTLMDEVRAMLANAPRGKGSREDIKALEADFAAVEASLADIERAFASEQFLPAKARAESAMGGLNRIKTDITTAIEMRGKR